MRQAHLALTRSEPSRDSSLPSWIKFPPTGNCHQFPLQTPSEQSPTSTHFTSKRLSPTPANLSSCLHHFRGINLPLPSNYSICIHFLPTPRLLPNCTHPKPHSLSFSTHPSPAVAAIASWLGPGSSPGS